MTSESLKNTEKDCNGDDINNNTDDNNNNNNGFIIDEQYDPDKIFKRMVIKDDEQNKRLSTRFANGSGSSRKGLEEPTKVRFFICILGLMALTTSQMSRMILNQSIPVMVDPAMISKKGVSQDGSCPADELPNSNLITDLPPTAAQTTMLPNDSTAIPTITPSQPGTTEAQPKFTTELPPATTPELVDTTEFYQTSIPSQTTQSPVVSTEQPETTTLKIDWTPNPIEMNSERMGDKVRAKRSVSSLDSARGPSDDGTQDSRVEAKPVLGERYMWDNNHRSTLLGGFYYGYFLFMIPGGRIAEKYGAKYVLLLSVAGSSLINLATPWMAKNSFTMLIMSRVLLGAIQSGVFPGMYALFNNWLTMSEANIFAPLIKMNLRLGMMFGSGLCGFMDYNWPGTFYFTGIMCFVWSILWLSFATSDPKDNRWVSKFELDHINKKKRKKVEQLEENLNEIELKQKNSTKSSGGDENKVATVDEEKTPWFKILTSKSVIGLIIVKLTFNYAVDFLVILLPSYLANVHHAKQDTISYITVPMFAIQVLLVVFVGWLASYVVKRRPYNLSKTAIRKIFQGISNGGMGLMMILLTFNNCNLIYVAIVLQIISFLSMFTSGGETVLPYDLSEKYPATIMAIANSVANLSGVTTTEISRQLLGDQAGSFYRWNILIYLVAGANIVGCIFFTLLIKAEPIDFEKVKRKVVNVEEGPSNGLNNRAVEKSFQTDESKPNQTETNSERHPAVEIPNEKADLSEISLDGKEAPEVKHSTDVASKEMEASGVTGESKQI